MLRFNTWALHAVQYGVSVEGFEKMRKGENLLEWRALKKNFAKVLPLFFLKLSEQFIMSKNSPLSMFSVNIIGKYFRYANPKLGELSGSVKGEKVIITQVRWTLNEATEKMCQWIFIKLSEQFVMSKNSSLSMFSVNIIDTFFRYVHPKLGEIPRFNERRERLTLIQIQWANIIFEKCFSRGSCLTLQGKN